MIYDAGFSGLVVTISFYFGFLYTAKERFVARGQMFFDLIAVLFAEIHDQQAYEIWNQKVDDYPE